LDRARPQRVAGTTLLIVSAPVWYPIMKSRHDQKSYDTAFDRCMVHGVAALATASDPMCYPGLGREGVAFCPRDITAISLLDSDSHWMVRR